MARKTQRLDKILANRGYGSRKEIKQLIKQQAVEVNGKLAVDAGAHVEPYTDEIRVHGETLVYREFIYIMMNKPEGVVSATTDARETTVISLLPDTFRIYEPFPVGRLDKDAVGLLLLTNDGALAHRLLSPKHHVPKTYFVQVKGLLSEADAEHFAAGIVLDDGYETLPAQLDVIRTNRDKGSSEAKVIIHEGKYHQVKRMFRKLGKEVIFLKRLRMGELELDESLLPGAFRELSESELAALGATQQE